MRYLTSVIATNQINRKNSVFTDDSLEDGARQINDHGGRPFLHSHDWTRLIGWTIRAWTEREGNILRLVVETEIPETDKEWELVSKRFVTYLKILGSKTESYKDYLSKNIYSKY